MKMGGFLAFEFVTTFTPFWRLPDNSSSAVNLGGDPDFLNYGWRMHLLQTAAAVNALINFSANHGKLTKVREQGRKELAAAASFLGFFRWPQFPGRPGWLVARRSVWKTLWLWPPASLGQRMNGEWRERGGRRRSEAGGSERGECECADGFNKLRCSAQWVRRI